MGSPFFHAESSVKTWGGKAEDYMPIHNNLDSSKTAFSDLRHRALTHHPWYVQNVLEQIFGATITNSDGRKVAVRDIAQQHITEDFHGAYPSVQDYLVNLPFEDWMDNGRDGAVPPSSLQLLPYGERRRAKEQAESSGGSVLDDRNPEPQGFDGVVDGLKIDDDLGNLSSEDNEPKSESDSQLDPFQGLEKEPSIEMSSVGMEEEEETEQLDSNKDLVVPEIPEARVLPRKDIDIPEEKKWNPFPPRGCGGMPGAVD